MLTVKRRLNVYFNAVLTSVDYLKMDTGVFLKLYTSINWFTCMAVNDYSIECVWFTSEALSGRRTITLTILCFYLFSFSGQRS